MLSNAFSDWRILALSLFCLGQLFPSLSEGVPGAAYNLILLAALGSLSRGLLARESRKLGLNLVLLSLTFFLISQLCGVSVSGSEGVN